MAEIALRNPKDQPASTKPAWRDRLLEFAHELAVLKVVTYVGGAEIVPTSDGLLDKVTLVDGGKPLVTICNLVDGDITNVIDTSLANDATMLAFHATQVEKASAVLPSNLKVLGELIKTLLD